jgi:hypothetical protein
MSESQTDPRHPSAEFLTAETEADRRGERVLVWKALGALALVVVLVVIRQLFFV